MPRYTAILGFIAILTFVPTSSYSQSVTYDSCTFNKILVREIGLKSSTAEHGVTFGIPQTLELFQTFGNVRSLNESLKMFAIGIAKFFANNFNNLVLGSERPGAFLIFRPSSFLATLSSLITGRNSVIARFDQSSFNSVKSLVRLTKKSLNFIVVLCTQV